jgi:hypothetical protein
MKVFIIPLVVIAAIVATLLLRDYHDASYSTRPAARWSYDYSK